MHPIPGTLISTDARDAGKSHDVRPMSGAEMIDEVRILCGWRFHDNAVLFTTIPIMANLPPTIHRRHRHGILIGLPPRRL